MESNSDIIDVHQESLSKKLGLSDLKKSNHEFAFRFWDHGQVIDITKDSTGITGTVTNFIYHQKKLLITGQIPYLQKLLFPLTRLKLLMNFF